MRPDRAGVHRRASVVVLVELSQTAGVTVTERGGVPDAETAGDGRREHRARRVNDGDRAERRERRRDQVRIRGGGPRGRQESDARGGEGKEGGEGGEGGTVPTLTPAAAATHGDGQRARGGNARTAAGAEEHARHGRRCLVRPTRTALRRRRGVARRRRLRGLPCHGRRRAERPPPLPA